MSESPEDFRLLGPITQIEVIARGRGIRQLPSLREIFGGQNWRKMKGIAPVERDNGYVGDAEIHWYEAHGVGRVLWKVKDQLDR